MSDITIVEDTFGDFIDAEHPGVVLPVRRFTMSNRAGMKVEVINYGAKIRSIMVPDRTGKLDDVALGFDDMIGYQSPEATYFGAVIGRTSNRIKDGRFTLDSTQYQLGLNENRLTHLHGGFFGFDMKLWNSEILDGTVVMSRVSLNGEEEYPGDVLANVTYELTFDNQLLVSYQGTVSKSTPLAMTNHAYFNLSGQQNSEKQLAGHFVQINATQYTPIDGNLNTTGQILPVAGTIFDFTTLKNLNATFPSFPPGPNGYDHNWCITQAIGEPIRVMARIEERDSGRVLEVLSDQPGLQFYSGNFLPELDSDAPLVGKDGAKYWKYGAFCVETQNYPNAINYPSFPNTVTRPGQVYSHKAIFRFTTLP